MPYLRTINFALQTNLHKSDLDSELNAVVAAASAVTDLSARNAAQLSFRKLARPTTSQVVSGYYANRANKGGKGLGELTAYWQLGNGRPVVISPVVEAQLQRDSVVTAPYDTGANALRVRNYADVVATLPVPIFEAGGTQTPRVTLRDVTVTVVVYANAETRGTSYVDDGTVADELALHVYRIGRDALRKDELVTVGPVPISSYYDRADLDIDAHFVASKTGFCTRPNWQWRATAGDPIASGTTPWDAMDTDGSGFLTQKFIQAMCHLGASELASGAPMGTDDVILLVITASGGLLTAGPEDADLADDGLEGVKRNSVLPVVGCWYAARFDAEFAL